MTENCMLNQHNNRFSRGLLLSIFAIIVFPALSPGQISQVETGTWKQGGIKGRSVQKGVPVVFTPNTDFIERHERNQSTQTDPLLERQLQSTTFDTAMFQPVPGPYGGTVRSIALDSGGWLFIATDGEVYRSTDNGSNWSMNLFPSQLHNYVEPVTILGPNIVVAETDFSNYISTNRGESWNYLSEDVQGFAVDMNGEIYAGSNYGGVKKSADTAKSWTPFALAGKKIWQVVLCGEGKFACPSDSGTYFSSDTGMTWIYRPYETAYTWNLVSDKRGRLFALRYYGLDFELYRSTDFGESWQRNRLILPTAFQDLIGCVTFQGLE